MKIIKPKDKGQMGKNILPNICNRDKLLIHALLEISEKRTINIEQVTDKDSQSPEKSHRTLQYKKKKKESLF